MKHAAWLILSLILAGLVFRYWADFRGDDVRAVAAPPLSLEGYLDEKLPEAPAKTAEMKVDNFACFVCHGNYEEEELVVAHGKKKVGCIDCHGESHAHRNDEDNVTPPDKMYAPEGIDKMCGGCHKKHDVAAAEVIARWQERCPAKTNPKAIICTDCHGRHRLKFRTVWWDKKTRKLIIRGKGERIKMAPDLSKKKPEEGADEEMESDSQMK
jgi:hypothetical protein